MPPAPMIATRFPAGFTAFDKFDVGAHLVAVDASDGGLRGVMPVASTTWSKPPALEQVGIDALLELQCHAAGFDTPAEVAQRFGEVLLAGYPLGDVELTADLVGSVEQGDRRGRVRRQSWRRPCLPARRRRRRLPGRSRFLDDQLGLVTGARIDQAGLLNLPLKI
jgi:hypothetical protein